MGQKGFSQTKNKAKKCLRWDCVHLLVFDIRLDRGGGAAVVLDGTHSGAVLCEIGQFTVNDGTDLHMMGIGQWHVIGFTASVCGRGAVARPAPIDVTVGVRWVQFRPGL